MKKLLIVTFQYGKRIEVYKLEDIHYSSIKKAKPVFTIDHRVMNFFGVFYFAPVNTKVSIYHDEVIFIQAKTGVLAVNVNEMGFP